MASRNSIYFLTVFLFSIFAFSAFDVAPIILKGAPKGPKASFSITATNTGDTKTPVQINVVYREPDIYGKEEYEKAKDASDLFQIIPAQVILQPKEKRTIRITYIGDKDLKTELAFRFIAEEFPVNVTDSSKVKNKTVATISILSKYVGSIFIAPEGAVSNLTAQASLEKNSAGNKMNLVIKNSGTAHRVFNEVKVKITSEMDKKEYELSAESKEVLGNQNILAGKEWRVSIPWPKEIPAGPVKIALEEPAKPKN